MKDAEHVMKITIISCTITNKYTWLCTQTSQTSI